MSWAYRARTRWPWSVAVRYHSTAVCRAAEPSTARPHSTALHETASLTAAPQTATEVLPAPQRPPRRAVKPGTRLKIPYYVGLFQKLINERSIPKPRHTYATFERVDELPVPPLRYPESWTSPLQIRKLFEVFILERDRRPHDVMPAGPITVQEITVGKRSSLRRIIDHLDRGIEDAERRVMYAMQQQEHDPDAVSFSPQKLRRRLQNDPILQKWKYVRRWAPLVEADALLSASATRKADESDVDRIISTIESVDRGESAPLCRFLLSALVRMLPNPKLWSGIKEKGLTMEDLRIDWDAVYTPKPSNNPHDCRALRGPSEHNGAEQRRLKPAVARFNETLRHLVHFNKEIGPGAFGQAIAFEAELARFRALLPFTEAEEAKVGEVCWAPVRRALSEAHRQGKLVASHINKAMWAALRYGIPHIEGWPTTEAILETYACMRFNLVQAEIDRHRADEGLEARKPEERERPSHASVLLPAFEGCPGLLPPDIVPTTETYCALIRGLAWHGDLHNALTVFRDLSMTEVDLPFEAYNGLFRAFGKHGRPARATGNEKEADGGWTLDTLQDLLDGFLSMQPPRTASAPAEVSGQGEDKALKEVAGAKGIFTPGTHEKGVAPFQNAMRARLETARSIIELEERLDVPKKAHGPSDELLYHLILALERCSSNDSKWVWEQCKRIKDKYGPRNKQGWFGWKSMQRFDQALVRLSKTK